MAEAERLIISRMPIPFVVSLQTDTDDKVDALAAICADCSAFVAGKLNFLSLMESVISFAQSVEETRKEQPNAL